MKAGSHVGFFPTKPCNPLRTAGFKVRHFDYEPVDFIAGISFCFAAMEINVPSAIASTNPSPSVFHSDVRSVRVGSSPVIAPPGGIMPAVYNGGTRSCTFALMVWIGVVLRRDAALINKRAAGCVEEGVVCCVAARSSMI
jgi:hypothetical protein